jgi:hypothetical protein
MPCRAEKKEKDIKWQRTNVKSVCARIDIKRNSFLNFKLASTKRIASLQDVLCLLVMPC